MTIKQEAVERLHDDVRRQFKEDNKKSKDEEEWIRMQTTGGGAET
tara:strand:- start:230 stop:364 length:135 start_codon:yes stop_codon:yes gene_type:complete